MEISQIKALKRDINSLRTIEEFVNNLRKNKTCDKLDFGFNVDSRFKGNNDVTVYLGGYKGFYGSSDVSSIFDIECHALYKQAFIETLNELRTPILELITHKLKQKLKENSDVVSKQIADLQAILQEIES